jgi:TRAP-type mannitol/chloroaromatic compound transport system permease large subunit
MPAGEHIEMADIYRRVTPIVAIQLAVLCVVLAYPWLATVLATMVLR